MTDVTLTHRPKSVCNRCVIKVFGGIFVVWSFFFHFQSVGVLIIELRQISSFSFLIPFVTLTLKFDLLLKKINLRDNLSPMRTTGVKVEHMSSIFEAFRERRLKWGDVSESLYKKGCPESV